MQSSERYSLASLYQESILWKVSGLVRSPVDGVDEEHAGRVVVEGLDQRLELLLSRLKLPFLSSRKEEAKPRATARRIRPEDPPAGGEGSRAEAACGERQRRYRVPDLQLDFLVVDDHFLGLELDTDGGQVTRRKLVFGELLDQASLAHARVANDNQFKGLGRHLFFCFARS